MVFYGVGKSVMKRRMGDDICSDVLLLIRLRKQENISLIIVSYKSINNNIFLSWHTIFLQIGI
jgi:hypothetical protein